MFRRYSLDSEERRVLYGTIATLHRTGLTLPHIFQDIEIAHASKPSPLLAGFRSLLTRWGFEAQVKQTRLERCANEILQGGLERGRGLTNLQGWIPDSEYSILSANFATGNILEGCESARITLEESGRIRNAILGAVAYPAFVFALGLVSLLIQAFEIFPRFAEIYDPAEWPTLPYIALVVSTLLINWGVVALALLLAGIWLVIYLLPRWANGVRSEIDLFAPVFREYRMVQSSIFLANLGVLIAAGMDELQALHGLAAQAKPWLRARIERIALGVTGGATLGQAMELAGDHFPDRVAIRYIQSISKSKDYGPALETFAQDRKKELVRSLERAQRQYFFLGLLIVTLLMVVSQVASTQLATALKQVSSF